MGCSNQTTTLSEKVFGYQKKTKALRQELFLQCTRSTIPLLYQMKYGGCRAGKDGALHQRLSKERVNRVKDFLTLLYLDPIKLLHLSYINGFNIHIGAKEE
ncbi:hypothetical protein HAX54_003265 [Datura stramonium]|uniref:Calmodulin binding protein central domain-containing protein n=1 Tax=Datura stramonium TaxID=4076 RepID=A0ABS8T5U3_DATST|nr:hypothetical protein [Datura stramonium]